MNIIYLDKYNLSISYDELREAFKNQFISFPDSENVEEAEFIDFATQYFFSYAKEDILRIFAKHVRKAKTMLDDIAKYKYSLRIPFFKESWRSMHPRELPESIELSDRHKEMMAKHSISEERDEELINEERYQFERSALSKKNIALPSFMKKDLFDELDKKWGKK